MEVTAISCGWSCLAIRDSRNQSPGILQKVLGFAEREALLARIMKIKVREMVSLS
jgi:hypothetical protein